MKTTKNTWFSEIPSDQQASANGHFTRDQVARLAYELWQYRRDGPDDSTEEDDWFEAERLLRRGVRRAA